MRSVHGIVKNTTAENAAAQMTLIQEKLPKAWGIMQQHAQVCYEIKMSLELELDVLEEYHAGSGCFVAPEYARKRIAGKLHTFATPPSLFSPSLSFLSSL